MRAKADKAMARRKPPLPEHLVQCARRLRAHQTDTEARLWYFLRDRRFGGFKFRRQHRISRYVLDFYSAEAGVAIEVDGSQHSEGRQKASDMARDAFLVAKGVIVLRFWDNDVLKETVSVLREIWGALPHPDPLPEGEGIMKRARVSAPDTGLHLTKRKLHE